jgi:hypothetical protein
MLTRKHLMQIGLLGALGALLLGLGLALGGLPGEAGTVETAYACNPCDCPEDRRNNCQGIEYYAIYAREAANGTCSIEAYRFNADGMGTRVFRVSARQLSQVPEFPARNTLIRENEGVALYRLTTGEYQVNAGPDSNNKVYVLIFEGCPATMIREETFSVGE